MLENDLGIPKSIPVTRIAAAWGLNPNILSEITTGDVMTSREIRRFILHNADVIRDDKQSRILKEYFVRFMVLSLKHPLIEDAEKGVLQLLEKDYLKPKDMELLRLRCRIVWEESNLKKLMEKAVQYFELSADEYIAQFPKRILISAAKEFMSIKVVKIDSKISHQMAENLTTCFEKMNRLLPLIPIVDKVSLEIIKSSPLFTSLKPIIGSLKLRKPVADRHTTLALGE